MLKGGGLKEAHSILMKCCAAAAVAASASAQREGEHSLSKPKSVSDEVSCSCIRISPGAAIYFDADAPYVSPESLDSLASVSFFAP